MPEPIATPNEESPRVDLRGLVRKTVEDTPEQPSGRGGGRPCRRQALQEDSGVCRAGRHERGHTTTFGKVAMCNTLAIDRYSDGLVVDEHAHVVC